MSDNGWRRAAADGSDFERISVYTDSLNDLALLETATDPVATNPSPALRSHRPRARLAHPDLVRMIKKFIDRLLGKSPSRKGRRLRAASASR